MAKLSKRVRAFREKVDANQSYPLDEAVALIKEFGTAKFNETVEVAVNLGVDARKSDQGVRGATTLPHGTGADVRVAVFAQGESADKAKALGAEFVGMEDLAEQIKGGMMDFDVVLASPDAAADLGGFMVRKSPKGRGGRKTNNPPGIEGTSLEGGGDVVIVEDVTTTGGSSIVAVERIHNDTACNVVAVISILDREEGAEAAFAEAGIPFESLLTRSDIVAL